MLKKVITIYLVLSILILAAGAVGVFWYTKDKPQPSVNQPAINEVANTNQPTTDNSYEIIPPEKTDCTDELDTNCWNIYRNNEYGFEFRYPGKMDRRNSDDIFFYSSQKNFSFSMGNNKERLSAKELCSGLIDSLYLFEQSSFYEAMEINKNEAYQFRGVPGMVEMTYIIVVHDDYFIKFIAQDEYHDLLSTVARTVFNI